MVIKKKKKQLNKIETLRLKKKTTKEKHSFQSHLNFPHLKAKISRN